MDRLENINHGGTEERRPTCLSSFPHFLCGFAFLLVLFALDASAQQKPDANLLQLMRGTLYPASNVLFAAQEDPGKQPQAADPSVSPNPLTNTYGGWQAVENAALAIAESSRLLTIPGRVCSN